MGLKGNDEFPLFPLYRKSNKYIYYFSCLSIGPAFKNWTFNKCPKSYMAGSLSRI